MSAELIVPEDAPDDLIRAAGGVVTRVEKGKVRVACIFRKARGDWTFPKGKLDGAETFEEGALREVVEEIGMPVTIVRFLGTTNYTHRKGKPKIVAYYLMRTEHVDFTPTAEVDELVWLSPRQVRRHLTWERDQELFALAMNLEELAS